VVSVLISLLLPTIVTVMAQTDRQVPSQSFPVIANVSTARTPLVDINTFTVSPQTNMSPPSSTSVVSPAIGSYSYTVINATSSFSRDTILGSVVDAINPPATSPLPAPSKQVISGSIVQ
jgi:hypothetical protein